MESIFLQIGLIGAIVYVIKIALTLLGAFDWDLPEDFDGSELDGSDAISALKFVSISVISAFAMGFGLTGYALSTEGSSVLTSSLIALVFGSGLVYFHVKVMTKLKKLNNVAKLSLDQCVGLEGEVFLPINNDKGQVKVVVNGTSEVHPAVLKTSGSANRGDKVVIVGVNGRDLIVEKK